MKRLLMLAALSPAAVLMFASPGTAQAPGDRAFTDRVTLSVTPTRDRTRPYTFRARGRIVPPGRFCNFGQRPIRGAGNCVPIVCPPGARDASYCVRPGLGVICSGKVAVRYQKLGTTISNRLATVRSDCSYRQRVTFRTRLRLRRGSFTVRARFQGNAVLLPRNAPIRRVRAG